MISKVALKSFLKRFKHQTFVVLYMPGFIIFRVFLPLVKLWNAVEGQLLFVLSSLEINDEEESLSQCVASRSIRRCHNTQNKTRA